MNALTQEIDARTRAFAREIADLVRTYALTALQQTLADASASARKAGAKAAKPAKTTALARVGSGAATKVAAPKAPSRSLADGRLTRRSPEELAKLTDEVLGQIVSRPGSRMESLRGALNVPTNLLVGPVTKLLAAGKIRKEGEKRATRYYATEEGGGESGKGRKGKGK